jgi:hypothetical protein
MRAGRISLMIEADEVALVLMLIEQNLLPENLQDDKCAITKKRFFQIGGGGVKEVGHAQLGDRRGRLTSIWQLIRAGGDQEMQRSLRKAGQKIFWRCDASEG